MKVAIVYDRLNKIGGAERVLVAFAKLFPKADWYTSFWDQDSVAFTKGWQIRAHWLNHFRLLRRHHEFFAWLMPFIFESYSFRGYDLVISISSEAAKGIITSVTIPHLNYCLTPTRYLWSHTETYLNSRQFGFLQPLLRPILIRIMSLLRQWDFVAATRPDEMIAISTCVKKRISTYYGRQSTIVYPPLDFAHFSSKQISYSPSEKPYYLVVSRLVPYKNIDHILEAFRKLPKETVYIIGTGTLLQQLRHQAPPNVHLIGEVAESELLRYYSHAKALIHPALEDFGLVILEAQAAGIPVLSCQEGGAQDIIQPGKTGMLYDGKSAASLTKALRIFGQQQYNSELCRKNAKKFDIHIWEQKIMERVNAICQKV